ncbi:hypothetical protein OG272_15975 [Streptomyces sp. NBC_00104]|uniref:hypothetical protein n=1 Tax=Streptomyces sp. NBC_00104 TaxID=2903621 RepID=UPI00325624C2
METNDIQTPERYGGEPLYGNLPADYSQRERPFTVTVADPGRYSTGRPTRYVVTACSTEKAWALALAWHIVAEETPDCMVLADESHEGLPDGERGIHWNDLRPEHQRQRDLDDLADQATELLEQFDAEIATCVDDNGEIRQDQRTAYERAVAGHRFDGWCLVRQLSTLDGR